MSFNDPIADMLTRIRNGQHARLSRVLCPSSNILRNLLEVLKVEGYIRDYSVQTENPAKPVLEIDLKYYEGEPVIREIKRVSKSGRRVYSSQGDLPRVHNGLGIAIVSTSKGVMSDHQARQEKIGGEVLCTVF